MRLLALKIMKGDLSCLSFLAEEKIGKNAMQVQLRAISELKGSRTPLISEKARRLSGMSMDDGGRKNSYLEFLKLL